ncbi:MAG TPA: alpha/beta fold hydrolase [Mycobacteriales bacterium]
MPVLPGAEPWSADGGRTGALMLHGFTGNPRSMRPWAETLAAAGLTVRLPLLPGHGTRWQDLQRTRWTDWYGEAERSLAELAGRCDDVFVMSLSMGGALSLRLAEEHHLAGQVLVNPAIASDDRRLRLLPLLSKIIPSVPPVGDDIKAPGVSESAYARVPTKAAASMSQLWKVLVPDLPKITAPTLVYRSVDDHVVPKVSTDTLVAGVTHADVEVVELRESFHVATLDNDAPQIFDGSLAFVRSHTSAAT